MSAAAVVFIVVLFMGLAFFFGACACTPRQRLKSAAFCVASAVCLWFPANVIIGRYEVSTDARECYSRNLSGCFQKVEK